jgi:hypothetical protein
MSCEVANGRLEVCKDAVGGIDAIYFINYGDYAYPTDTNTNSKELTLLTKYTTHLVRTELHLLSKLLPLPLKNKMLQLTKT